MEDSNYSPYAPHDDSQARPETADDSRFMPKVEEPEAGPTAAVPAPAETEKKPEEPQFKSRFQSPLAEITGQGKAYLKETGKWSRFLGIICIVGVAMCLLLGILMIVGMKNIKELAGQPALLLGLLYVVLGAVLFFPAKYLRATAKNLKAGLALNDNAMIEDGIKNIKSYYKFSGIYTIVCLAFVAAAIITGIIIGIAAAIGIG